jgi:hypothetical protein
MRTAFSLLYVQDYATELCKQQAQVVRTNMFAAWGKANTDIRNIRGLNLVVTAAV